MTAYVHVCLLMTALSVGWQQVGKYLAQSTLSGKKLPVLPKVILSDGAKKPLLKHVGDLGSDLTYSSAAFQHHFQPVTSFIAQNILGGQWEKVPQTE